MLLIPPLPIYYHKRQKFATPVWGKHYQTIKEVITIVSILTSVKKMLGIENEYAHFDTDLIMHINSALSILTQIGVGPPDGFLIKDNSDVWTDFIPEDPRLEMIKSYIHLKVKLIFDPPLSSAVIESINRMISEYEWRLQVAADLTVNKSEQEFQNEY